MNPVRHIGSHWDFYRHLVEGDLDDAAEHRRFYDEYNAVCDLPAEYYLDCIRIVFQEHLLPRGLWHVGDERVAPEAITRRRSSPSKASWTTSPGTGRRGRRWSCAAGIPAERKHHVTIEGAEATTASSAGAGGARWCTRRCGDFIAQADADAKQGRELTTATTAAEADRQRA